MRNALAAMAERYAEDGFPLPATWEGRMEALVNGAIDADDMLPQALKCAAVADQGGQGIPWTKLTHFAVDDLVRAATTEGADPTECDGAYTLADMGSVADAVNMRLNGWPTCNVEQLIADVGDAGSDNAAQLKALREYVGKLSVCVEPLAKNGRIPWAGFCDLIEYATVAVVDDLDAGITPQASAQAYMLALARLVERYSG